MAIDYLYKCTFQISFSSRIALFIRVILAMNVQSICINTTTEYSVPDQQTIGCNISIWRIKINVVAPVDEVFYSESNETP